jgi:hypothetical protein
MPVAEQPPVDAKFPIIVPVRDNPGSFNPRRDLHFRVWPTPHAEPFVMLWPVGRHGPAYESLSLPVAEALHAALGEAITAARADLDTRACTCCKTHKHAEVTA